MNSGKKAAAPFKAMDIVCKASTTLKAILVVRLPKGGHGRAPANIDEPGGNSVGHGELHTVEARGKRVGEGREKTCTFFLFTLFTSNNRSLMWFSRRQDELGVHVLLSCQGLDGAHIAERLRHELKICSLRKTKPWKLPQRTKRLWCCGT